MRTVRLRAPRDDLVRRGAILLEDALRTASRPNVPGRRLLVVRSFAIGAIHARGSATDVAIAVERRLRDVESRAVHALDVAASSRDAVFFLDRVEAYAALAGRVAAQRSTDAWFWPLAVPTWHRGMPRDEALRALLFAVLDGPPSASAGAALVGAVAECGALGALLGALRPVDGPPLLRTFGWDAPDVAGRGVGVDVLPAPDIASARMRTLADWAPRWGAGDARSTWLAGTLLVLERPVRAVDPQMGTIARALVECVVTRCTSTAVVGARTPETRTTAPERTATVTEPPPDVRSAASAPPEAGPATPSLARRGHMGGAPVGSEDAVASPRARPTGGDVPAARPARELSAISDPAATSPSRSKTGWSQGPEARETARDSLVASSPHRTDSHDTRASAAPDSTARAPDQAANTVDRARADVSHDATQHAARARTATTRPGAVEAARARVAHGRATIVPAEGAVQRSARAGADDETRVAASSADVPTRRPAREPGSADGDNLTAHAGLFLLLPLASRLGMPTLLAAHPELVELDFPTCLLRHVAERLGIPDDDPVLAPLLSVDETAVRWDGDFVAPEAWLPAVAAARARWLVRRAPIVDGDDRQALTDGSWRLVLALWRGSASESVHELADGVALAQRPVLRGATAMNILLGSWLTAMRRWCRRYAGIGLHRLVSRRGRVATTRMHLDVYFDLRQIDIGVRRAGLDIDPGWLPWFGRVVAYHYVSEGRDRAG